MAESVAERESTHGTDGVYEERMRAVERINIAAAGNRRPARRLNCSRTFKRKFVEVPFPFVLFELAFVHQPKKIAIGADVVEAMVMYAYVRHMRSHERDRMLPARFQESFVAGRIKLQNLGSKLESLCPLSPTAACVAAIHCKDRGAFGRLPGLVERIDLLSGDFEESFEFRLELFG